MVMREIRMDAPVRTKRKKLLPAIISTDLDIDFSISVPVTKGNLKLKKAQIVAKINQRLCWRWIMLRVFSNIKQNKVQMIDDRG
jgi:hypothetical protein